jgi:MYXO-CTERM domain-containing protein
MTLSKYLTAFTILGTLTLSAPAWADIPPDDQCPAQAVGKPCHNALSDSDSFQPGICKEAMCTRATPDGAMTYACYRCEALDEGLGGQSNEGGTGGGETAGGNSSAGTSTNSPGGTSAGGTSSGGTSSGGTAGKTGSSGAVGDPKSSSDDGGGCSVSHPRGTGSAFAAALAALGFAVAGLRRRRSPAS